MSSSDDTPKKAPSTSSIFANAAKARRHTTDQAATTFTLMCATCGAPRQKDDALACRFCGSTLTPKAAP